MTCLGGGLIALLVAFGAETLLAIAIVGVALLMLAVWREMILRRGYDGWRANVDAFLASCNRLERSEGHPEDEDYLKRDLISICTAYPEIPELTKIKEQLEAGEKGPDGARYGGWIRRKLEHIGPREAIDRLWLRPGGRRRWI